jgi:three-Cys-motif partner protein
MAPRRRSQPLDPTAAIAPLFDLPPEKRLKPRFRNPTRPVWSENKARFIARYLQYFVFVTKHGTYIDGFAGPQKLGRTHMWTAKLVLESQPRWLRHFYLFDVRRDKIRALMNLKASQPPREKRESARSIEVIKGDFNTAVRLILASGQIGPKEAAFCLLDQHTFECRWDTLQALATYPKAQHKNELLYFLPSYWLGRALHATKKTVRIEAWWGRGDWRELRGMAPVDRAYAFAKRFRDELGYWSAEPWAIYKRRDGGPVMYYLIHATDHELAPGLMRRAYDNAARPPASPQQVMLEIGDLLK